MKETIGKLMLIILVVTLSISSICMLPTNSHAKAKPKSMYVTATAYTDHCEGCSGITAIGINLRKNPYKKVIAVDKRVIPLNSVVYVNGYGLAIAGDTGGAIKGKKIDVFMRSKKQALNWGRKTVKISIQSYSK
ncbi:3D (Asp-Asp-Asp) domain-containing protein [Rummeliibacillus stabekisii]|nr:3D (Asp-Asp-Asp) domain-containing protein [Rummeliibacillus stabekisii]GEL05538.1 hypothetical protein RST01_21650 [Rummeliibacillus stabekisii]